MAVTLILQTDQLQHIGNTVFDFLFFRTNHTHGKCHVFINRHILNQSEILEHNTDSTAHIGQFSLADLLQGVAVDMNRTGSRLQLTGNQADNGGLSGTGRTP